MLQVLFLENGRDDLPVARAAQQRGPTNVLSPSAAVLVFLAAAAGAGVVAADLRAGADGLGLFLRGGGFAHDIAGFALRRAARTGGRSAAAEGARRLVQCLL